MPDGDEPVDPSHAPEPPGSEQSAPADAVTPGGYAYEVVDDDDASREAFAPMPPEHGSRSVPAWALFGAMIVAALIAGLVVWFLLPGTESKSSQALTTTGAGLLNAFTAGGETSTTRYEGEAPPGYPEDVPMYDVDVVSSVLQISEASAGYIIVQHSEDDRDTIAEDLSTRFSEGSWQIDGGQESTDATLIQFSKTDDANVSGIVLLTQSKDGERTTIITSVQDAGGAEDPDEPFVVPGPRNVPSGFPSELVPYPDAILIESAYQKESGQTSFALSYITDADAAAVVEHYRTTLEDAGLTVEDGDPTTSPMEDAQVLSFSNEDLTLQGEVAIGTFAEDEEFTRIDVQAGDERDGDESPGGESTPEEGDGDDEGSDGAEPTTEGNGN